MTTKTLDRNYNPVTDKIDNNYKRIYPDSVRLQLQQVCRRYCTGC